jgi:hypothetical protein
MVRRPVEGAQGRNKLMALLNTDRFRRDCESPTCPRPRRSWKALFEADRGYSLDGHWYCSSDCFIQALSFAVGHITPGSTPPAGTTHRAPLGLLMLSRGFVDNDQLKTALKAQKEAGSGRVGDWLRHLGAVSEDQITQMLGLQWSIPVFPINQSRRYLECANMVPLPLLQAAAMVPVHYLPASQVLYVAFSDRASHSALYSVEKMLACRTEPCLIPQSQLLQALREIGDQHQPVDLLAKNISDPWEIANAIWTHTEKLGAVDVRVSGFGGFIWARIFGPAGHTDVLVQSHKHQPELFFSLETSL